MTSWSRRSAPRSSAGETAPGAARDGAADGAAPGRVKDEERVRIDRARDGDHEAFRALYERYAPMVHAVLLAHGPRAEADDLAQDVFLSAWRSLHRLRRDEHVGGWLAAIARNRGRRALLRARPPSDALADEPADPESAPARRDGREDGAEALALLAELPAAYRETLAMRLVEGMTGPEIAAATGLTHGSVRVNLFRGMALYEELLRKRGWPR